MPPSPDLIRDDSPAAQVDLFAGETPLPTQRRFLESPAPRKVYIGPVGSGKSQVLIRQAIILSHLAAPNFGMIARQTYPELRDTTRKRFMEICPPALIRNASIPTSGGGYIEWEIGGVTVFRHLDTTNPMEFGSLDLGYLGIDEITEMREAVFDMLETRLGRHWSTLGIPQGEYPYSPLFGTGNPGGQDFIWRKFFKPGPDVGPGKTYEGFQPAPKENEANLPAGYYVSLAKGKAEWWIRRFLRGDMRALEGLVWPQFDQEANVIRPIPIPETWHRRMSLDHGQRNPTAAQWWAIDPWGNAICYRDYEVAGPTPKEHVRAFKKLERGSESKRIELRPADPSMFSKTQAHGDKWWTIAEEYAEAGMDLDQADNAMEASRVRVGQLLWADPDHRYPPWHPKAGQAGAPYLYYFNSCERSIEEVSSWRFKDWKGGGLGLREEPVDFDDHLCDCTRYFVLSFPDPSEEEHPPVEPSREQWQIERKKRAGRAIRREYRDGQEPARDDYA